MNMRDEIPNQSRKKHEYKDFPWFFNFFSYFTNFKRSMDDNNRLTNDILNLILKITGYMKVNAKLFLFTEAKYVMQFRLKCNFAFSNEVIFLKWKFSL